MISEKTVELNLSMESINHINFRNNLSVFAIAPTQQREATVGYDVEIGDGIGSGILIQYKRAIPDGNEYIYHLNYTKHQNQHQILCDAEMNGATVLYALPLFHEVAHIRSFRRRLLRRTAWYKPSQIPVPNGGIGKHDLHIDLSKGSYYMTSERIEIGPPMQFREVNNLFDKLKTQDLMSATRTAKFLNLRTAENTAPIAKGGGRLEREELSEQFMLVAPVAHGNS